ncbi:hypothetical protein DENSPDRAFT_883412 [Dentipellis sp. KUC8613]|nr:hypothetical protein DENSPDRAFT_883412 [Dentipellis sp. KUC8613]
MTCIHHISALQFDNEVELIWKQRWSWGNLLFLWSRYYIIGFMLGSGIVFLNEHPETNVVRLSYTTVFVLSEKPLPVLCSCFAFLNWQNIGSIIQVLTIHIILELRIWAMYRGVRVILVLLIILPIAEVVIFSVIFSMPPKIADPGSPAPELIICIHGDRSGKPWGVIYYVVIFATESILLVLSLWKAWTKRNEDLPGGMYENLFRDSAYYFALIFWVYVINLIIWIYNIPTINELGTGFASALSSILANRLLISIRSAHYRDKPAARILDLDPPTITSVTASVSRMSFMHSPHDDVSILGQMPVLSEITEEWRRELGPPALTGEGNFEAHELQTLSEAGTPRSAA